ncbi:molybdopterin molybdenumtransferase 1 domain protein [Mycobacterium kansasii 732]|nr:molybdopterin molybdenumtransferase 1 domain protein [Mycobacterium kansasii 732]
MMVRPLIRLSLGKRQPMRRIVQARTLSPITSVAGRKGYLRGQLMRDQDSGEYLVQALAEPRADRRTCWPPWPRPTVWLWFPPEQSRFAPARSSTSPSWLSTARRNRGTFL